MSKNVPESDYMRGRREAIEDAMRHLRGYSISVRTVRGPLAAADEIQAHEAAVRAKPESEQP